MANTLYDALFKPHEASEATFLRLKDGSTVSYAGFLALSARFAHAMAEAGITPGDRVALQARKSVEALAVYAAAVRMGAVFLPLNTAYTAAEVDYFVSDAGAKLRGLENTTSVRPSPLKSPGSAASNVPATTTLADW